MQITLVYDASAAAAPAGFATALAAAADYLDAMIVNPITVSIGVGYGEFDGEPLGDALGEGGPAAGTHLTYAQVASELAANASVAATLLAADPTGGSTLFVSAALEKAWGLIPADAGGIDGIVGFSSTAPFDDDPSAPVAAGEYDFFADAMHELTHALGRVVGDTPLGLFGYSAPGTLALASGEAAYFSTDGGAVDLATYDTVSDPSDWTASYGPDAFDTNSNTGVPEPISPTDLTELGAMGFDVDPSLAQSTGIEMTIEQGGQWITTAPGDSTVVTDGSSGGNVVVSEGNDAVVGGAGPITVLGANPGGSLQVVLGSGSALVFSEESATIALGTGPGTIVGDGGSLSVTGPVAAGGADTIFGGSSGLVSVSGGAANLLFVGGSGASAVTVGGGAAFAGSGASTLIATAANTTLAGGLGSDQLTALAGGDILAAGAGNETLNGSVAGAPDTMFGGSGNDLIELGNANAVFVGNAGACTVVAGAGDVTMWVGAAPDTFQFSAGSAGGTDLINGFRPGTDRLVLPGYGLPAAVAAQNGSTVIALADGTQITLAGVMMSNLTQAS